MLNELERFYGNLPFDFNLSYKFFISKEELETSLNLDDYRKKFIRELIKEKNRKKLLGYLYKFLENSNLDEITNKIYKIFNFNSYNNIVFIDKPDFIIEYEINEYKYYQTTKLDPTEIFSKILGDYFLKIGEFKIPDIFVKEIRDYPYFIIFSNFIDNYKINIIQLHPGLYNKNLINQTYPQTIIENKNIPGKFLKYSYFPNTTTSILYSLPIDDYKLEKNIVEGFEKIIELFKNIEIENKFYGIFYYDDGNLILYEYRSFNEIPKKKLNNLNFNETLPFFFNIKINNENKENINNEYPEKIIWPVFSVELYSTFPNKYTKSVKIENGKIILNNTTFEKVERLEDIYKENVYLEFNENLEKELNLIRYTQKEYNLPKKLLLVINEIKDIDYLVRIINKYRDLIEGVVFNNINDLSYASYFIFKEDLKLVYNNLKNEERKG